MTRSPCGRGWARSDRVRGRAALAGNRTRRETPHPPARTSADAPVRGSLLLPQGEKEPEAPSSTVRSPPRKRGRRPSNLIKGRPASRRVQDCRRGGAVKAGERSAP